MTSGRVTLKKPSSDVRVTRSQSPCARVGKGASFTTPALLTTTSMAASPSPLQGASAAAVSAALATSNRSSVASPPAATIAPLTSAAPRSSLR